MSILGFQNLYLKADTSYQFIAFLLTYFPFLEKKSELVYTETFFYESSNTSNLVCT